MVQNNSLPLVSIVVVTYNSSSTILETLDSIKAQTYRNIELIVSDDHSTDNTIIRTGLSLPIFLKQRLTQESPKTVIEG